MRPKTCHRTRRIGRDEWTASCKFSEDVETRRLSSIRDLILSTIHSAKGQEWKTVHILNVVDGCIPSDMSAGSSEEIEEERRLLYVAMTRAKDHLHLIVPQRFYTYQQAKFGDGHVYAALSRFLTDQLLQYFERCAWPVVLEATDMPVQLRYASAESMDISTRARAQWQLLSEKRLAEIHPPLQCRIRA